MRKFIDKIMYCLGYVPSKELHDANLEIMCLQNKVKNAQIPAIYLSKDKEVNIIGRPLTFYRKAKCVNLTIALDNDVFSELVKYAINYCTFKWKP